MHRVVAVITRAGPWLDTQRPYDDLMHNVNMNIENVVQCVSNECPQWTQTYAGEVKLVMELLGSIDLWQIVSTTLSLE